MDPTQFETAGGVRVSRTATPFDPALLTEITQQVEARRGGVLSSGMEYPGRYSRWHMAYVDPCVELVARGRRVPAPARNGRGQARRPGVADAMGRAAAGAPRGAAGPGPAPAGPALRAGSQAGERDLLQLRLRGGGRLDRRAGPGWRWRLGRPAAFRYGY